MWTNHLEYEYNSTSPLVKVEYWCYKITREGKSFDNEGSAPCVLLQINAYILFAYMIGVLL
jgi:hypothetical protein